MESLFMFEPLFDGELLAEELLAEEPLFMLEL